MCDKDKKHRPIANLQKWQRVTQRHGTAPCFSALGFGQTGKMNLCLPFHQIQGEKEKVCE